MASPNIPLGLAPSPLAADPYGFGSGSSGPPLSGEILTEAGTILRTESNSPLLTE